MPEVRKHAAILVAVNDVVASTRQRDDGEGRGVQGDGLCPGLRSSQVQHAPIKIDLGPSKIQDLAQPASGEPRGAG